MTVLPFYDGRFGIRLAFPAFFLAGGFCGILGTYFAASAFSSDVLIAIVFIGTDFFERIFGSVTFGAGGLLRITAFSFVTAEAFPAAGRLGIIRFIIGVGNIALAFILAVLAVEIAFLLGNFG